MVNDFSSLSAESEISSFAQVGLGEVFTEQDCPVIDNSPASKFPSIHEDFEGWLDATHKLKDF